MSGPPRLIDRLASPDDDMLRLLVHQAANGIAIIDRHARLVRVNRALRRMVGTACDLSSGANALGIFSRPRRDEVWEELGPVLLGARPPRTFISMVPGKDGVCEHTVDVSAVALREADGLVSGVILHLSDISVQTRLEAQLAQGLKLQALGQFTSGIAHDFNNLLMAMIGAADEVLARGPCDDGTRSDLQLIRTSGERGASLVRELLAFGRQQPLLLRTLPVNQAVSALSHLLLRLLGSSIDLLLALGEAELTVRVDPGPLDQVLVNLVVNARNAMPDGGVVTVTTGHVVLDDSWAWDGDAMAPGRYVTIEVSDTGVGIPPHVLPRIFDPFFTTRGEQGGSGLGLSTVHAIIRRFHGFLTVDSRSGVGTTMRVYLPRHDAPVADIDLDGDPARVTADEHGCRTLLLVDDEDGVRQLTARALTARGWHVVAANSAEDALDLLQGETGIGQLAIIVTDVMLPGMDGPALVQTLRKSAPGLPALLTSGYGEEAIRAALRDDNVRFLSKPYTLAALAAEVERHAWASDKARQGIMPEVWAKVPLVPLGSRFVHENK